MGRVSRKFRVDGATGKLVQFTAPEVADLCDEIEAGTNVFKRSIFEDDSTPGKSTRPTPRWPIVSTSAGIDAEDIPVAQKYLAERGVPTEYTRDGDPVLRDRAHRREFCRVMGFVDRDGGYGDFTG